MKNYEITIGYKAVFTVSVKAKDEQEAKQRGVELFSKQRNKMMSNKILIQDDNFGAYGCVDMDATWNMYTKD